MACYKIKINYVNEKKPIKFFVAKFGFGSMTFCFINKTFLHVTHPKSKVHPYHPTDARATWKSALGKATLRKSAWRTIPMKT